MVRHGIGVGPGPAVIALAPPDRQGRRFAARQLCYGVGQVRILHGVGSFGHADAVGGGEHVGDCVASRRHELLAGKLE